MMAGFPKKERQAIIDSFLTATGRNQFVPTEFLEWLTDNPDNPAHEIFYGMDDAEAAHAYRIEMVRNWVSGLRISVAVTAVTPQTPIRIATTEVKEIKFPAMISPMGNRRAGGGYVAVDPNDPAIIAELCRQAARDLENWIERYQGVLHMVGGSADHIKEIAGLLRKSGVVDAA